MFSFKPAGSLSIMTQEWQVPDGRIADYEYTQPRAYAASEQPAGQIATLTLTMADGKRIFAGWWIRGASEVLALMFAVAGLSAQTGTASPQNSEMQNADELVKAVVRNEVAAASGPGEKHLFTSFKKNPKGTQTHIYVETNDAMAGMLVALNGAPLTQAQLQTEDGHLQWLENNPDQLRRKRAREKDDSDRSLRIVRALPYAFHFEYAGVEEGKPGLGAAGDELVKLKFTPNPGYQPPSREEQVLTGMRGYLLVDMRAQRLAKIDGELFRDVEFGWGILGHLDKGGHFLVCQGDVGENSWEITQMNLQITGKILLIKSLSMISSEILSDFQRVPENLSFAQGVQLLKAEQEKYARNEHGHETAQSKP
ncbi:MAG: hypothetical protein WAN03_16180 [Candidatus Sulfotelmatobacter sp.]